MEETYDNNVNEEVKYYDSPNLKETCGGIFIGLIYLFILASVLYSLICSLANPHTYGELNVLMLIAEIVSACLCITGMVLLCKRNFKNVLASFKKIEFLQALKYMFFVLIAGIAWNYILIILDLNVETNANQASLNEAFAYAPFLTIIFTCVCAPIIEELIFRYFVYKPISRKNKVLAIILSGVAFGAIHMVSTFVEFFDTKDTATLINDLLSLPDYILAGCIFSCAYAKTNKLSTSVVAHSFYNIFATVSMFLSTSQAPLKYQDVQTDTNSITITYTINEEVDAKITKIELYVYNQNEEKVTQKTVTSLTGDSIRFNDLQSGYWYYIDTTYTYTELDSLNTEITTEEVLTYYAKTR